MDRVMDSVIEMSAGTEGGTACPPTKARTLDDRLCFSFYAASMAIGRIFKPLLDGMGITYPQVLVLHTLWEKDGSSIGEIAERLFLESSTVTPLVKRMELAGLLRRQRSAADERQVHVRLTDAGREIQNRIGCLGEKLISCSGMSQQELDGLNKQTQALLGTLNKERKQGQGES